jgi:uncharacterized protein DUF955
MRRGFKTQAETEAETSRHRLGLKKTDRLPARELLADVGAIVTTPSSIPGLSAQDIDQLTVSDSGSWSAITVRFNGTPIVIVNDSHSLERQESSLHHEAAHLLCGHEPSKIVTVGGLTLREYDDDTEKEASWMGGCLHMPRSAILSALRRGADDAGLGRFFVASADMVRYRRSVTGVDRQLRPKRRSR